jgi:hypothetical protein
MMPLHSLTFRSVMSHSPRPLPVIDLNNQTCSVIGLRSCFSQSHSSIAGKQQFYLLCL